MPVWHVSVALQGPRGPLPRSMWDPLAARAARALCLRTLAGVGDESRAHWSDQERITLQLRRPMNADEIAGLDRARPLPVETGHE